jgi:hypothetical protein
VSYQGRLFKEQLREQARQAQDQAKHERAAPSERPAKVFRAQTEHPLIGMDTYGNFKI